MIEEPASSTVVDSSSLWSRVQRAHGQRRLRRIRENARPSDREVDGLAGNKAYCDRLLTVYDAMRGAPSADPPRASRLLSHPPEWTRSLWVSDGISEEGFSLEVVRAMPKLQAALANCTAYSPSKWLLEQEMGQRYANRTVAQSLSRPYPLRTETVAPGDQGVDRRHVEAAAQREQATPKQDPEVLVRAWLLEQLLQGELDADVVSEQSVPSIHEASEQATGVAVPWSDRRWILEIRLAGYEVERLLSELPRESPHAAKDVGDPSATWAGGERSWPTSGHPDGDVYDAAAAERLAGLCLSGGGIRSATFCLGILQTLAQHDELRAFDYISSVSGGGYIHQWLAAWIHREPAGLQSVQRKLLPLPSTGSLARTPEQISWLRRYSSYLTPRRGIFTADTWTMVAIWFRNTLLNQVILFSFLAVVLVLIRAMMHPFVSPPAPAFDRSLTLPILVDRIWQWIFALISVGCVIWASWGLVVFAKALRSQTQPPEAGGRASKGAIGDGRVLGWIVLPGFLLSVLVALAAADVLRLHDLASQELHAAHLRYAGSFGAVHLLGLVWALYVMGLLIAVTGGGRAMESSVANTRLGSKGLRRLGFLVSILCCTALPAAAVLGGTSHGFRGRSVRDAAVRVAADLNRMLNEAPKKGVPTAARPKAPAPTGTAGYKHSVAPGALLAIGLPLLLFGAQFMAIRLNLGLIGRSYEESRREWLARYGAWAAVVSLLWFGLGCIALIGPYVYYWFFDVTLTREFVSVAAVSIIHAITLYSGSSSKTSGVPDPRKFFGYSVVDLAGIVLAPIAIVCLLIVTSGWVDIVTVSSFRHVYRALESGLKMHPSTGLGWIQLWFRYVCAVSGPVLALLAYAATLLLFGWRVDVNEFSLHPFYRDRLARCYLGASNGSRVPDPFTGFDDHSEVSYSGITLAELLPARFGGVPANGKAAYSGPMPIFCATVNLTFGQDLAFQDRKGASFFFSPAHCGYHVGWTAERESTSTTVFNGFVPTGDYAYRGASLGTIEAGKSGVNLSTVAAVSGAALSPNQGFSSQPTLAFLMTLFNVRLGWWIANPRKPWIWPNELEQPTPRFGLRYLLSELFGYSDDTSNYVSLADGGRFDNMGLYELVRRRCSRIVICDGEQDDKTTFEGLGLAITKARIDFGVEIEFAPGQIEALAPDPKSGRSTEHFARGTIRYPAPPGGDSDDPKYVGEILYLKTAYVGDEPVDLLHYKREHPDFPQETTLNQWFTESQFESYRRLGQLTAELAFNVAPQRTHAGGKAGL